MATDTTTLSPEEQAAAAAMAKLSGANPDNNPAPTPPAPAPTPADPTAGKNGSAQNEPTPEDQEKTRLSKRAADLRRDFDRLVEKLPEEARKTLQEQFKSAVPKLHHTCDQLLAMLADLNVACDMVGRLNKVLQAPTAPPAGPNQSTGGQQRRTSSGPIPPPPGVYNPSEESRRQESPPASRWSWFTSYWKHWLAGGVAVITLLVLGVLFMTGVIRVGGQGSSGGTQPKQPANVKFDL